MDDLTMNPKRHPALHGMRHNGSRWVAENSLDTERAIAPKEESEYFVGIAKRKAPRAAPKPPKSRRRGGF